MMETCVCNFILNERRGDEICLRCGFICPFYSIKSTYEPIVVKNDFIKTVCANNNIAKCIEEDALLKFGKRGKKTDKFAAYCIYYACKKHKVPRTVQEISSICFVSPSNILEYGNEVQSVIKPSDLVSRVCYRLGIDSFNFQTEAGKLGNNLFSNLLVNSPPQSVLGVSIYVLCKICKKKHMQRDIAKACYVSTSCIRRLYRVYKDAILSICNLILTKTFREQQ